MSDAGPNETASKTKASSTEDGAPARTSRWRRRLTIGGIVAFVVYTLFGFFVVPSIIRGPVCGSISESLTGAVTIERATFNPFTFGVTLENTVVTDANGEVAISFRRFEGNVNAVATVFRSGYRFAHARVIEPMVNACLDKNGALNLAGMGRPNPEASSTEEALRAIPHIVIHDLSVTDAAIHFTDETFDPPFSRSATDLDFIVGTLDTDPEYENPHTLSAQLGDLGRVTWKGSTWLDPLTADGTITVEGFDLAPFSPYLSRIATMNLDRGTLGLEISYSIAPVRTGNRMTLEATRITLSELAVTTQGHPLLELNAIELSGLNGDVEHATLSLDTLAIDGVDATLRRSVDGSIEILTLLSESEQDPESAAADTPADIMRRDLDAIEYPIEKLMTALEYLAEDVLTDWTVELGELTLNQVDVAVIDRAVTPEVETSIAALNGSAGPMSSIDGFATNLAFAGGLADRGTFSVEGSIAPNDGTIELNVDVSELGIAVAAPYLPSDLPEPVDGMRLDDGALALNGTINATRTDDALDASWAGRVDLSGLKTSRPDGDPPIVTERLTLDGTAVVSRTGASAIPNAEWTGTVGVQSLHAALMLDGSLAGAALTSASHDGTLTITPGATDAELLVTWNGSATMNGVSTTRASMSEELAFEKLTIDGDFKTTVPDEGGQLNATWDGTLTLGGMRLDRDDGTRSMALAASSLETTSAATITGASEAPALNWNGDLRINGVEAESSALAESNARLASLVLAGGTLRWQDGDGTFDATSLALRAPAIAAVAPEAPEDDPDTESTPGATEASAEPTPLSEQLPLAIRLGTLTIDEGSFTLEKRGLSQPVIMAGDGLTVRAEAIDTRGGTPMSVNVESSISEVGRVGVTGSINPFLALPSLDVVVSVADLPLRPLSPVAEPNVGYTIDRGRLTLELPIRVEDGEMDGDLNATLSSFYLGTKVPSTSAPKIPMKFGLDLLRDRNDVITARIGLSGNTTDPEFDVNDVIWDAIFGLLGKIVTSPFQLIANAFGGDDDVDLSRVTFELGKARLVAGEASSLDILATAMKERPRLNLVVSGLSHDEDVIAMRRAALRTLLDERIALGQQEDAALKQLFAETFPELVKPPVPVPPGRRDQVVWSEEAMRSRLAQAQTISAQQIRDLEQARAERVAELLVSQGGVDPSRVTTAPFADLETPPEVERAPIAVFTLNSTSGVASEDADFD